MKGLNLDKKQIRNVGRSKSRESERNANKKGKNQKQQNLVKLYVGKLGLDAIEDDLITRFSKAGKVHHVTIVRENRDGRPLNQNLYGFVVMTQEDANYAVELYHKHPKLGWTVEQSKDRYKLDNKGSRVYRDEEAEKRQKKEDEEKRRLLQQGLFSKKEEKGDNSPEHYQNDGQLYAATLLELANDNIETQDKKLLSENLMGLIQLAPQKLSKIANSLEKNLQNGSTILVRELWLGNITSNIDEVKLKKEMDYFGKVENTEFYQKENKSFAFVKFKKVKEATTAYEAIDHMKLCLDCPNLKVSFSDHLRRKNIVGDNFHNEDKDSSRYIIGSTLRNSHYVAILYSSPNEQTSILYIGFTPGSIVESEAVLKDLFQRYGEVINIQIKQSAKDNSAKSYVLIEMGSLEQAKRVRDQVYFHDIKKEKRIKLGDKNCELCILVKSKPKEISKCIQNPNSLIKEYNRGDFDIEESPQKLYNPQNNSRILEPITEGNGYVFTQNRDPRKQLRDDFLDVLQNLAEIVKNSNMKDCCEKYEDSDDCLHLVPIWSGFITKSKQRRVGIDAHLHFGNSEILSNIHNIDISRRDVYDAIRQDSIDTLVSFVPSNDTQITEFMNKIEYLQEKERAGVVILPEHYLFILPPGEAANRIRPIAQSEEMLGVFIQKRHIDNQESPNEDNELIQNFEDIVESEDESYGNIISNKNDLPFQDE